MKLQNLNWYRRFWTSRQDEAYGVTIRFRCTFEEKENFQKNITELTAKFVDDAV